MLNSPIRVCLQGYYHQGKLLAPNNGSVLDIYGKLKHELPAKQKLECTGTLLFLGKSNEPVFEVESYKKI